MLRGKRSGLGRGQCPLLPLPPLWLRACIAYVLAIIHFELFNCFRNVKRNHDNFYQEACMTSLNSPRSTSKIKTPKCTRSEWFLSAIKSTRLHCKLKVERCRSVHKNASIYSLYYCSVYHINFALRKNAQVNHVDATRIVVIMTLLTINYSRRLKTGLYRNLKPV